jgi:CheY-like chemotaxis protein
MPEATSKHSPFPSLLPQSTTSPGPFATASDEPLSPVIGPGAGPYFTLQPLFRTEHDETPPGGSETVLLLEGDDVVRGLIAQVLHEAGYFVLAAATTDDALCLAEANDAIHLLIADLLAPAMGCESLLHRLAARHPPLRTICLSVYPPEVLPCTPALLTKPFRPVELLRAIRKTLAQATSTRR